MTGDQSEINVDKGVLDGAAARLVDARSDFERLSSQLETEFASLKAQWQGEGGMAFQQTADKWREAHRIIVAQLEKLADTMGVTVNIAMNNDDDVSNDMQLKGMSDSLTHY